MVSGLNPAGKFVKDVHLFTTSLPFLAASRDRWFGNAVGIVIEPEDLDGFRRHICDRKMRLLNLATSLPKRCKALCMAHLALHHYSRHTKKVPHHRL